MDTVKVKNLDAIVVVCNFLQKTVSADPAMSLLMSGKQNSADPSLPK